METANSHEMTDTSGLPMIRCSSCNRWVLKRDTEQVGHHSICKNYEICAAQSVDECVALPCGM